MSTVIRTDALIVGAGPVGLFAAFELGLFDMKCHLVDILDRPGGQCAELYPDKPIYDIPGMPSVNAQELVDRLIQQIAPFKPQFTLNSMVMGLERLEGGGFRATTDENEVFEAKVVVIAAGGGAFQPKRLSIPGIEAFEGKSVFYRVRDVEDFRDQDVLVAGDGDSALEWAIDMQPVARRVTLAHGRREFSASPGCVGRVHALQEAGLLDVRQGRVSAISGSDGHMSSVTVRGPEGDIQISCTRMLPFLGRTTKLGPVSGWGLDLHEDLIAVDTEKFQTAVPGVFAIGDINWYPGKLRLLLSGFHEAALMAQAARRIVKPAERTAFEYTTSSTSLQKKLGVA